MSSYLAGLSPLILAIALQTISSSKIVEADMCIRFDVTEENTTTEEIKGDTKIIQLTPDGTESLRQTTASNIGQTLCVYADEVILMTAIIQAEIDSGTLIVQSITE